MYVPRVSQSHAREILGDMRDGDMQLALERIYEADRSPWSVPAYRFDILAEQYRAGTLSLRVGDDERLVRFAGQVGFGVDEQFRGRRLAGRAVRLLLPLAASHGLNPLWLSCNPDNAASMGVMRWLDVKYVETVDLPPDYDRYYSRGERQKRRYRLDY